MSSLGGSAWGHSSLPSPCPFLNSSCTRQGKAERSQPPYIKPTQIRWLKFFLAWRILLRWIFESPFFSGVFCLWSLWELSLSLWKALLDTWKEACTLDAISHFNSCYFNLVLFLFPLINLFNLLTWLWSLQNCFLEYITGFGGWSVCGFEIL